MKRTSRAVAASAIAAAGLIGVLLSASAVASPAGPDYLARGCDSDDYFTNGHNGDRSDGGCDTTRYENRGHNGNSAPDHYDYGHGRASDDRPLGEGLFNAL